MPVIIPTVFRVAFNWEGPSPMIAENVMHFSSAGDEGDVWEAIANSVIPEMWACTSDTFRVASVSVTKLDSNQLTVENSTLALPGFQGLASGDFMPNCCALVKHTTASGGRSGRGRTYCPALAESRQQNGVVAVTQRNQVTAAWNDFQEAILAWAQPVALGIASYTNLSFAAVTNSTCEPIMATQRRRLKR